MTNKDQTMRIGKRAFGVETKIEEILQIMWVAHLI